MTHVWRFLDAALHSGGRHGLSCSVPVAEHQWSWVQAEHQQKGEPVNGPASVLIDLGFVVSCKSWFYLVSPSIVGVKFHSSPWSSMLMQGIQ